MRDASYPAALLAASVVNGYDAKLDKRFPYDPAASKKLLAEAGYPKGFMIVLDCPNDRYVNDEAICQAIAGMLAKVGIEVKLNSQTKSKHFAKIASMDTSFFMVGWAPLTFDVHNTFFNNVMTREEFIKDRKAEPGQGNWNDGGYSNPKVDEAMEKAATEVDPKKRQASDQRGDADPQGRRGPSPPALPGPCLGREEEHRSAPGGGQHLLPPLGEDQIGSCRRLFGAWPGNQPGPCPCFDGVSSWSRTSSGESSSLSASCWPWPSSPSPCSATSGTPSSPWWGRTRRRRSGRRSGNNWGSPIRCSCNTAVSSPTRRWANSAFPTSSAGRSSTCSSSGRRQRWS